MQAQKRTVLALQLRPHSRRCQLSACHFQARSRFLRTVSPVAAAGFELVVLAVAGRTKEVGHLAAHAGTVVAESHSDMIVPGHPVLSRLVDSTPPAPPHLA
jgi:hypothetical protein